MGFDRATFMMTEDEDQKITIVNKGELKEDMEVEAYRTGKLYVQKVFLSQRTAIYTFYTVGSSATYKACLYDQI